MAAIKDTFVFLTGFLLCFSPFVVEIHADTHTAASCSYSDVSTAITAASTGDIVLVPSGSCTWKSMLTISTGITLQGAGKTSTVIIHDVDAPTINITLDNDVPIRITGIGIDKVGYGRRRNAIRYARGWSEKPAITKLRIDHNRFTKGNQQLFIQGYIYGVIDNNEFVDGNCSIRTYGDNNYAWTRTIEAGTANALFIEDNTFSVTNALVTGADYTIYHSFGSRTVTRYNTVNYSSYTKGTTAFFDSHGNQSYYSGIQNYDFRGQPIIEVYNNNFNGCYVGKNSFTVRSGSLLIHDNSFTGVRVDGGNVMQFYEEEDYSNIFRPLRTQWPAQDQITNTFLWNNTCNWSGGVCSGGNITDISVLWKSPDCIGPGNPLSCCTAAGVGTCDDVFIQKDRDYFMHPPQAIGGKSTYTGRLGGSTTAPTTGDTGNLTFTSSGPNAYYPYTPYTYPHPLRKATEAPQNLRIE